ncbi:MAG: hypothetical protein RML35_11925 [Chloroherpetonaceae bacterium]|nr:hypothetical protein [Chloroherpetonaceae bacterium]MDW8466841.1 hypothetical protein [Chloroherpetonaceae bacterium]
MATITIEVPDEIAKQYDAISANERESIAALIRAYFLARHRRKVEELQALMTEIGEKAERNGLTPEILEQILSEK